MRQPFESLKVSHATHDGAHEDFDWTDSLLLDGGGQVSAFSGGLGEAQVVAELFFADGSGQVDLVGQNQERRLGELFNREEALID